MGDQTNGRCWAEWDHPLVSVGGIYCELEEGHPGPHKTGVVEFTKVVA